MTATCFAVMLRDTMRTTVTLDPDVERLLREAMHRRRQSFKETLNQAIRHGLTEVRAAKEQRYKTRARPLGLLTGIDPARLNHLADEMEADAFLSLSRKPPGERPVRTSKRK